MHIISDANSYQHEVLKGDLLNMLFPFLCLNYVYIQIMIFSIFKHSEKPYFQIPTQTFHNITTFKEYIVDLSSLLFQMKTYTF